METKRILGSIFLLLIAIMVILKILNQSTPSDPLKVFFIAIFCIFVIIAGILIWLD